ncbi:MAG TPA: hypothetical protein VHG08_00055 [Longimicrobium sp.]|nr:hypothetical protein [Longimicrobium sp.]
MARERLRVEGGRALFVRPVVLEPNGRGEMLLAGDISFLLEQRPGGAGWAFVSEDSTFGAIIPAAGEPVVVPAPIPTRLIGGTRALAREDGGWDVVFAQVHGYTGRSRPFTVERLWHGVLDGARWRRLEPVPVPAGDGDTLDVTHASALLRVGDTLFWAASLRRPGVDATTLFAGRGGAWEHEIVPTLGAGYPRIAHADSLGLVLAVVGPDRTLPSDGNSLILWTRRPEWRPYRKLVPSSREQVYDPWISLSPGSEVAGWVAGVEDSAGARTEAHAMWGRLDQGAPVAVLDPAVRTYGQFAVRPLEPAAGVRLWVLAHVLADGRTSELRIVQESGGAAAPLAAIPVSFPAGFVAALPAPGRLLVAGAEHDAEQRMVVSLLLRFQVDCPSP